MRYLDHFLLVDKRRANRSFPRSMGSKMESSGLIDFLKEWKRNLLYQQRPTTPDKMQRIQEAYQFTFLFFFFDNFSISDIKKVLNLT